MPHIGPSSYGSESGIEVLDAYLRTNFVAEMRGARRAGVPFADDRDDQWLHAFQA
ncbi:hypothetical protein [Mesorhizobium sp.]|uniref:hypothetical protein n=1 Tax=Mesorhizobium sp. TaxID=1871066 RepID=UPI00257E01A7|nr:hypothetical protein [Mesorhizobium sp.]